MMMMSDLFLSPYITAVLCCWSPGCPFRGCSDAADTQGQRFMPAVTRLPGGRPELWRRMTCSPFFSMLANTKSPTTKCSCGASASPELWESPASCFQTAAGKSPESTSWLRTDWTRQNGWGWKHTLAFVGAALTSSSFKRVWNVWNDPTLKLRLCVRLVSAADLFCRLRLRFHADGFPHQRRDQAVGDGSQQGLSAGLPANAAQPP